MGLLHRLSQWLDSYVNKEHLEREEHAYEHQLEYVKGYLGDKPKEALQKIFDREDCYRLAFKDIQSLAALGSRDHSHTNAVLRQIENMCNDIINPQEESELTP